MEVFVVISMDEGFYVEVKGVFSKKEDAENYLTICSNNEEEVSIYRSILK